MQKPARYMDIAADSVSPSAIKPYKAHMLQLQLFVVNYGAPLCQQKL